VDILFSFRELIRRSSPADASKCSIFEKKAALSFVIKDLGINQITHFSLILFSIEVAVKNRHYVRTVWTFLRTGVAPEQPELALTRG
jgi:hypothetical protein